MLIRNIKVVCLVAVMLVVAGPLTSNGAQEEEVAALELVKISLYEYGEFIEDALDQYRDEQYDEAFKSLSTSARWGDKLSQLLLSVSYLQGLGTPIDNVAGTAWLIVAVESENRRWEDFLRDVREAVSEEENTAASELASRLAGYYGMKAMNVHCSRLGSASSRLRPVRCVKRAGISGHRVAVPKDFPL